MTVFCHGGRHYWATAALAMMGETLDRLRQNLPYDGLLFDIHGAMSVEGVDDPEGDMIGHVTDLGKDYENPNHRGYQTSAHSGVAHVLKGVLANASPSSAEIC